MADERIRQPVKIVDATTDANQAGVDASGNLQVIAAANGGVDIGDVTINGPLGGGVEAGAVLVTIASDSTGLVTVDGTGTLVVQVDGAALTALQLIDDMIYTDDTDVHATGSSKGAAIMAAAVSCCL